jgi:hypothetical protein
MKYIQLSIALLCTAASLHGAQQAPKEKDAFAYDNYTGYFGKSSQEFASQYAICMKNIAKASTAAEKAKGDVHSQEKRIKAETVTANARNYIEGLTKYLELHKKYSAALITNAKESLNYSVNIVAEWQPKQQAK